MRVAAIFIIIGSLAAAASMSGEREVRAAIEEQMKAWNAGDLESFVKTYSEETVFVGKEVTRGNAGVLARYRRSYPTRERMGVLAFSDLEVGMLGREYASVLGRFHLKRSAEGGGDADGIFTLLLRKTARGWRIVLDHTS